MGSTIVSNHIWKPNIIIIFLDTLFKEFMRTMNENYFTKKMNYIFMSKWYIFQFLVCGRIAILNYALTQKVVHRNHIICTELLNHIILHETSQLTKYNFWGKYQLNFTSNNGYFKAFTTNFLEPLNVIQYFLYNWKM